MEYTPSRFEPGVSGGQNVGRFEPQLPSIDGISRFLANFCNKMLCSCCSYPVLCWIWKTVNNWQDYN